MNSKLDKSALENVSGGATYDGYDCNLFECADCGAKWEANNNNGIGYAFHKADCKHRDMQGINCGICAHYRNFGCGARS